MQYVRLGRSGLKVSRIGLGMMSYGDPSCQPWALAEDQAEPIVRRAVDAGITFFDTADMYSDGASEQITGRLLRNLFPRRHDYCGRNGRRGRRRARRLCHDGQHAIRLQDRPAEHHLARHARSVEGSR
jgi:hypothetical protein